MLEGAIGLVASRVRVGVELAHRYGTRREEVGRPDVLVEARPAQHVDNGIGQTGEGHLAAAAAEIVDDVVQGLLARRVDFADAVAGDEHVPQARLVGNAGQNLVLEVRDAREVQRPLEADHGEVAAGAQLVAAGIT